MTEQYDAQYIVKVDDDVFMRLDRLPHAVAQWRDIAAGAPLLRMPACALFTGTGVASAARCWRLATPPLPLPAGTTPAAVAAQPPPPPPPLPVTVCADYVGCMKTGQIIKSPRYRWYEPQHQLLGSSSYFTHAWGRCVKCSAV